MKDFFYLNAGGFKNRAYQCEGYIMFRGQVNVTPKNKDLKPFVVFGTWLYKPEYKLWYCNGRSYMPDILDIKFLED